MHTCTYIKTGILSFVVSFSSLTFTVGIVTQPKFVIKNGKRVTSVANEEALTPSAVDCARLCEFSTGCTAANYLTDTQTCQIFKKICFQTADAIGWSLISRPSALIRTFHYISNQTLTWQDAKNNCESVGGRLANVLTTDDRERILSILSLFGNPIVWLGGSDLDAEGEWVWSNGCRFDDQNFNFWSPNEPNNAGNNEHCLEFRGSEFNDKPCPTLRTFICEINAA